MKKITLAIIALILASLFVTLTGCEMTLNLKNKETSWASLDNQDGQVETAVLEITNEAGSVVARESVTMTPEQIEIKDNFFKPAGPNKPTAGPSNDRIQEAIKNNPQVTTPGNDSAGDTQVPGGNASSTENGSNNNPTNKPNPTPTPNPTPNANVQDDYAVLNSNQYMILVRIVDNGEDVVYKIARNGNKSAMMFDYDNQEMGLIIDEKNVYLLNIEEQAYIQAPKEMLQESAEKQGLGDIFNGNPLDYDREIVAKTTETIDGVQYNVYEYKDGIKDYFVGKTIIKTVANDGSVMYYDNVSAVAPNSIFIPPAEYEKTELTNEAVSDFAENLNTTAPEHKHE